MPGHDIIVIGTSAGGLKALGAILGALPADINAVLFIVQHLAADKPTTVKLLGFLSESSPGWLRNPYPQHELHALLRS